MDIILIRHGQRVPTPPEKDPKASLTQEGLAQADHIREQLVQRNLHPGIYLRSNFKRSLQAAERLSSVYPMNALTPSLNPNPPTIPVENILPSIIEEAHEQGVELDQQTTIAIVGHEPQLSQMLAFLTSTPTQSIDIGKGVWIRAASLSDFLQGQGRIQEQIN
jgi:phosphohistidine phosphatase SixA